MLAVRAPRLVLQTEYEDPQTMYESFFGFQERPFNETGRLDFYFPGESIEQARHALTRVIDHAAGPGLVVGPAGTGKTLLCRMLADQYRSSFDVVHLACNRLCTRRALLQNILFELKLAYRQREEGELRLSLIDHLGRAESQRQGMLLLVDEAHTLPLRLLDEVRMITNLVRDGQPRVRLIVVGGPALEEKFAHPKLESFNQRIAARCYLGSLTREETRAYVRHRVATAGGPPEHLYADEALRALYQATDGIPRLINQIGDHALTLTASRGGRQVSAAVVEEAWADLQQLPTPWRATAAVSASPEGIVEFGVLEDDLIGGETSELEPVEIATPATATPATATPATATFPSPPLEYSPIPEPPSLVCANDVPTTFANSQGELAEPAGKPAHVSAQRGPFDGEFEEEEVIVCRYSSLEAANSRGRLKVVSAEGDELGAELARIPQPEERTNPAPAPSNSPTGDSQTGDSRTLDPTAAPDLQPTADVPVPVPVAAEPAWVDGVEMEVYQACQFVSAIYDSAGESGELDWANWPTELAALANGHTDESAPATVAARIVESRPDSLDTDPAKTGLTDTGLAEAELAEAELAEAELAEAELAETGPAVVVLRTFPADDRDIIIVEDEDEGQFGPAVVAIADRPQAQEYRQLFAKLRQT